MNFSRQNFTAGNSYYLFFWHFQRKTNCWYYALWCNNSLVFYFFCRKRVVISGLCGWPFHFGPRQRQLHTNRQQYYIREWHSGLKFEKKCNFEKFCTVCLKGLNQRVFFVIFWKITKEPSRTDSRSEKLFF